MIRNYHNEIPHPALRNLYNQIPNPTLKTKNERSTYSKIDKGSLKTRTVSRMSSSFRKRLSLRYPNRISSKIYFILFFSVF